MKLTASGRYSVYGGMDHPGRGEAREVGIFDLHTRTARRVELPATCWHVACHPSEDRFYAFPSGCGRRTAGTGTSGASPSSRSTSSRSTPRPAQVLRHWSAGQDTPAHINSDVCISDRELIYCNGASGTIVMIDLASFTSYRILDERPDLATQLRAGRQAARTVVDTLTRGSIFTNGHHHLRALRVARGTLVDSVYACQLSADQSLLFTANRGPEHDHGLQLPGEHGPAAGEDAGAPGVRRPACGGGATRGSASTTAPCSARHPTE